MFYVTDNGLHGLEVAPEDLGLAEWGCYRTDLTGADGTVVGTGAQNTTDILADCAESGTPAALADAYELYGFIDWYLPSIDELRLLYFTPDYVIGIPWEEHWSSSEINAFMAYQLGIFSDKRSHASKDDEKKVRPFRAF
ncbi:MAG: DUF1566 domain-containing protein [Gammaproteobacteria bacterium]|nr:DUF1566 domain-containing protein [Gammaproteobacteria bacterium]